jgi:hypothetical protein
MIDNHIPITRMRQHMVPITKLGHIILSYYWLLENKPMTILYGEGQ